MFTLIWKFIKIGFLTFGGGSAAAPLIHKEFVEKSSVISDDEFIDIVSVANSLPGPSMPQMAAIVGYKQKGVIGASVAVIAIIIPITVFFTMFMIFISEHIDDDVLQTITAPALAVISALMLSLSLKFYRQTKNKINLMLTLLIISIVFTSIYFLGLHPSVPIVVMIILVISFGGGKNVVST